MGFSVSPEEFMVVVIEKLLMIEQPPDNPGTLFRREFHRGGEFVGSQEIGRAHV